MGAAYLACFVIEYAGWLWIPLLAAGGRAFWKDHQMAVAVRMRLQLETQGLATFPRGRQYVQLGLHLRDARELHVESCAQVGDFHRLRLQLCVEPFEGSHRSSSS